MESISRYVISGGNTLTGKVRVSGAKNSALKVMAASIISGGRVTIRNVPDIEDVRTMVEVLRTLNADVDFDTKNNAITIDPRKIDSFEAPYELVRKMRASILVAGPLLSRFGQVSVAVPGGCNIGIRQIDLHLKGFGILGASHSIEHGDINCIIDKRKRSGSSVRLKGNEINLDFPSRGATE